MSSTSFVGWTVLSLIAVWTAFSITHFSNAPLLFSLGLLVAGVWLLRPDVGLSLVLLFSFVDFRTQIGGISLRLYEIVTLVVVIALALSPERKIFPRKLFRTVPIAPFIWLWLFGLLTVFTSVAPARPLIHSLRLAVALCFVSLSYSLIANRPNVLRAVQKTLVTGLACIVALGYIQIFWGIDFLNILRVGGYVPFMSGESVVRAGGSYYIGHSSNLRPFSFFATPHIHTVVIGLVALYLIGLPRTGRIAKGVALLALLQVLISDVYGAILALLGTAVISVILWLWRRSRILATAVAGLLASGAMLMTIGFWVRAVTAVAGAAFLARLQLWKVGWEAFLARPLLGSGAGTAPQILGDFNAQYGTQFDHVHNWYLEVLAETGIIGLLLLLYFLIAMTLRAGRVYEATQARLVAPLWVLSFYAVFNLVDSFVGGGNVAFFFFLVTLTLSFADTASLTGTGQHAHAQPPAS